MKALILLDMGADKFKMVRRPPFFLGITETGEQPY